MLLAVLLHHTIFLLHYTVLFLRENTAAQVHFIIRHRQDRCHSQTMNAPSLLSVRIAGTYGELRRKIVF